ncbi:MAG: PAS domain S-box protein [Magnetococcus sp. YQC-5]
MDNSIITTNPVILIDDANESITERINASHFQMAFENAAHGMALVSPGGRFLKVNQALCALIGYTREKLLNIDFQSITYLDDLEINMTFVRQMLAGTISTYHLEERYVHHDSHLVWVLVSVSLVCDEIYQPVHLVMQIQEITTRKNTEAALLSAKKQLEIQIACINRIQSLFIEASQPNKIFYPILLEILKLASSTHGFITEVKHDEYGCSSLQTLAIANTKTIQGYTTDNSKYSWHFHDRMSLREDFILTGQSIFVNDLINDFLVVDLPTDYPLIQDFLRIPIKRGEKIVGLLGLSKRLQSNDIALLEYLEPVLSACAQIIIECSNRNRRIEIEEKLRNNEALMRATFESIRDGILVLDGDGTLLHANTRFREIWLIPDSIILKGKNKKLLKFVFKQLEKPELFFDRVREIYRSDSTDADILEFKDGRTFDCYSSPLLDNEGNSGRVWIFTDITERKQVEHALQVAKNQADMANEAKRNFLSVMSHEIRTPMNIVIGMSDILLDSDLNKTQRQNMIVLKNAGTALLEMVNDIFDLNNANEYKLKILAEPMHIQQEAQSVIDSLQALANKNGLSLEIRVDPSLPKWIVSNTTRFRQLLFNLINNALKFTEFGWVVVDIGQSNDDPPKLLCIVSDSGIGIRRDHLKKIFDSFTQSDTGISRSYGGTGLGLSLTKQLLKIMGGTIWVNSELGKGSQFHFTLPLHITNAPDPKESHNSTSRPAKQDIIPLKILLVDDVEENRVIISLYLENTLHHLTMVCNGAEGIQYVKNETFDLILMDIEMPVLNGLQTTTLIREWEKETQQKPLFIVAISAHSMEVEAKRCFSAGCNDYLSKPITKRTLLEALGRYSMQI